MWKFVLNIFNPMLFFAPVSLLLTIVFGVLKMTDVVSWTWWTVTSPIWFVAVFLIALVVLSGVLSGFAVMNELFFSKEARRRREWKKEWQNEDMSDFGTARENMERVDSDAYSEDESREFLNKKEQARLELAEEDARLGLVVNRADNEGSSNK